jgi:L-iditol 2-dehydrogenase
MAMKALIKTQEGPGHFELLDVKEPVVGLDSILIEVAYAGICGTDVHIMRGHWKCNTPVILGHEFSGRIADVGAHIKGLKKGSRVVAGNPASTCGACYHCRSGNPLMCKQRISMGYMINGAFAKYVTVGKENIHRIPDEVSLEEAALCEPLSVAVRAMTERVSIHAGDRVLVSGVGPIGLLCMAVAKAEGATTILCGMDNDEQRLACGKNMGANLTVNVEKENVEAIVKDQTDGDGVDVAVECAGAAASLTTCLRTVRKEGTVVQVGIYSKPFQVDFDKVVMNELQVYGVYGYVWSSWEKSLVLLRDKRVDVKPLITHKLPLSRWKEGFESIRNGSGIKVLLQPE